MPMSSTGPKIKDDVKSNTNVHLDANAVGVGFANESGGLDLDAAVQAATNL